MSSSITNRRIAFSIVTSVLLFIGFYFLMEAVFKYSMAHADGSSISTPTTSAVPTVDVTDPFSDWNMVKTYGWVWGGMIVLATGLSIFAKKNDEEHWIGKNNRILIVLTGLAGVLSSILVAHFDNAGWAGVVATMFGAVKLAIFPPKNA